MQRKLDELDDSIIEDQRVVRAQEAWRGCMREATGTSYEDSEAVEDEILTRFQAIAGADAGPGAVAAPAASFDQAALAEVQQLERDLIAADLMCEEKHITAVEDRVREEKEAQFTEDNAELLRQVKPLGS